MTVFSESDRYCRRVRVNREVAPNILDDPALEDLEPGFEEEVEFGYRAAAWVIRDRLEAIGFTLDVSRSVFEAGVSQRLNELRELSAHGPNFACLWSDKIALLEDISFDAWLREFCELKQKGIHPWHLSSWSENPTPVEVSPLGRYMLTDDSNHWLGYPLSDIRHFLRAVIEACGDTAVFEQDVSEVTNAGWYEFGQAIVENARAGLISDFPSNAKIIILTEGTIDRRALEGAFRLVYPHLIDLYSFMDFDGPGFPGGVGHLVNTLKAFAGAGIANKVIALFDNDTGARSALRAISQDVLPRSMRVLRYPPIEVAKSYPTIGPSGLVQMDVNGLAGSLEMYFGEDVLKQEDGSLTPVQWRGYDQALCQYQGELLNKARLQAAFFSKLDNAMSNPVLRETQDWSGMTIILDAIRSAFSTAVMQVY